MCEAPTKERERSLLLTDGQQNWPVVYRMLCKRAQRIDMEGGIMGRAVATGFLLIVAMFSSGCSVLMAANRESYRGDVGIIKDGVSRTEVIAELGQPDSFFKPETGGFDDRYVLDPEAHRTWVKVGTVVVHLGADLVTAFLWELVGTPYELAVRDRKVIYHLAYNPDGKLSAIEKIKP